MMLVKYDSQLLHDLNSFKLYFGNCIQNNCHGRMLHSYFYILFCWCKSEDREEICCQLIVTKCRFYLLHMELQLLLIVVNWCVNELFVYYNIVSVINTVVNHAFVIRWSKNIILSLKVSGLWFAHYGMLLVVDFFILISVKTIIRVQGSKKTSQGHRFL